MTHPTPTPLDARDSSPTAADLIDARPLTRNQRSLIGLVMAGNIAEFFDMFLIGFVVSLLTKPWALSGFAAGTILACSGLGTVVGSVLWGRLGDRIGRRRSFRDCVLVFVAFTALSLLTPDRGWWLLALSRVGVGIGVGGLNITSIPYVQEFVPAKQRGLLSGLASVFIPLGLLLGAQAQQWLGGPLGWRGLIGLGIIPVLLLVWLRRVPESPRFAQLQGRDDDARAAYAWALELPAAEVGRLPVVARGERVRYRELWARHRRSLVVVAVGSFCFILGSFTVQSWGQTLLHEAFGYSASMVGVLFSLVSIADLAGRLGAAWLADRVGRRAVLFGYGLAGAAGCLLAAFAPSGPVFFAGIVVAMMFGDGAFGILNAFGAEQFPTAVRSTGLGLGYGIGSTAKVIGPALMGALVGGSAVRQNVTLAAVPPAFVLFAIALVAGGVCYLFARETRNVALEAI